MQQRSTFSLFIIAEVRAVRHLHMCGILATASGKLLKFLGVQSHMHGYKYIYNEID